MKGYNRKGGPKRVDFKIDIQKAYDTCVTNVAFILSINGDRVGYFNGGRGLRQDDLLVMCHVDTTSVRVIKNAFDEFSAYSGLLPNSSKGIVFFGSPSDEEWTATTLVLPFITGKLPRWPLEWYEKIPVISLEVPKIDANARYKVVWRTNKGISMDYSVKAVNNDLRN
ncbi:hypothetical protein Tco_0286892 [Tanacetum coccineum]